MGLTKNRYLEISNQPELAKAVLSQLAVSWRDLVSRPEDYRDPGAGIPGFIYYEETTRFAIRNLLNIKRALNEFENESGTPLEKPTDDDTRYLNWLAWFALESVVDEIMCILDK